MSIAVIAFAVCFPVLVNTVEGVRAVPSEARDTAAMLHLGAVERLYRIYLPGGAPLDRRRTPRRALDRPRHGRRLRVRRGSGDGLGRYILFQQAQFNMPEMYAGILFLGLLGYVLNQLFLVAERRPGVGTSGGR